MCALQRIRGKGVHYLHGNMKIIIRENQLKILISEQKENVQYSDQFLSNLKIELEHFKEEDLSNISKFVLQFGNKIIVDDIGIVKIYKNDIITKSYPSVKSFIEITKIDIPNELNYSYDIDLKYQSRVNINNAKYFTLHFTDILKIVNSKLNIDFGTELEIMKFFSRKYYHFNEESFFNWVRDQNNDISINLYLLFLLLLRNKVGMNYRKVWSWIWKKSLKYFSPEKYEIYKTKSRDHNRIKRNEDPERFKEYQRSEMKKIKQDPILYQKYLEREKNRVRNKDKQKEYKKKSMDRIKQDPIKYREYLDRHKEQRRIRLNLLKQQDPIKYQEFLNRQYQLRKNRNKK